MNSFVWLLDEGTGTTSNFGGSWKKRFNVVSLQRLYFTLVLRQINLKDMTERRQFACTASQIHVLANWKVNFRTSCKRIDSGTMKKLFYCKYFMKYHPCIGSCFLCQKLKPHWSRIVRTDWPKSWIIFQLTAHYYESGAKIHGIFRLINRRFAEWPRNLRI